MKRITALFFLIFLGFSILGCFSFMNSRVVRQTDNSAIIQGIGASKVEAKLNAEDRAKEIFGSFKETAEAECSQESRTDISESKAGGVSGSAQTYWSCTIQVEKN